MRTLKHLIIAFALITVSCGEDDNPVVEEITSDNLLNYAGENHAAVTFESGTNVAAVYFPASELDQKPGKSLSEVQFYLWEVPESILLSVMNADAIGDSEDLLYQVSLTSELQENQWNSVALPNAISLDEQDDIWIILSYQDDESGSFMGCDEGPQVRYGAMFISSTQGGWQRFFVDVNWNIRGVLTD